MKFTYTIEMKKQDDLWKSSKENVNTMKKLQEQILQQAYDNGYKGYYTIDTSLGESTVRLYTNFTKEEVLEGEIDFDYYLYKDMKNKEAKRTMIVGNCIDLIKELKYVSYSSIFCV